MSGWVGGTTEIRYKCHCMADEATLHVRARQATEDVVQWMKGVVQRQIGHDHRQRSPTCRATTTEYAKVKLTDDAHIGAATEGK